MNLDLITSSVKENLLNSKRDAHCLKKGDGFRSDNRLQLQRTSQTKGKNKGMRVRGGTWGVLNVIIDSVLLERRGQGGERR